MKNFKVIYYIAGVFLMGVVTLVYLTAGKKETTEPKIKLSYFESSRQIAESIHQHLPPENHVWFGIEPGHQKQLEIFKELKEMMEPFDIVYIDQELKLGDDKKSLFGNPIVFEVKEKWGKLANEIKQNADKRILIITAAIYSTNLIPQNPSHKINTDTHVQPTTISMGYLAAKTEDEKNNAFPCITDDKEGVAAWGCLVLNKARSQRRKIDPSRSFAGLMDQTGEKDFFVLVN